MPPHARHEPSLPARSRLARAAVPLAALASGWLASGCGWGTASVSGSGGGGAAADAQPFASDLSVERSARSPAPIRFRLQDEEGDPADVAIRFRTADAPAPAAITLAPSSPLLEGMPTNEPAGHVVLWDFAADLGGEGYRSDVEIELVVVDGASPPVLTGVEVGNDPPELDAAGPEPAGAEEHGANVDLGFVARDSSGDPLRIQVEYNDDAAAGHPEGSWKLARPAGTPQSQPTPEYAIAGFVPDPEGTPGTFQWDTAFDLEGFDDELLVRFTPEDDFAAGPSRVTEPFRVDNNAVPRAILESGSLLANPDRRRGIAIPFTLFDDEADDVRVVLQWRELGEPFPDLPGDPQEIEQILADPQARADHAVATELPITARGRVEPIDATSVRLPELAGAEGAVLGGRADVAGDLLALLRPSRRPEPLGLPSKLLAHPVGAIATGDGRTALVLDGEPGWRLREIELATGAASAFALERGGDAVLVAETLGSTWRLRRVDLATGELQELPGASGDGAPVHGVASLARGAAVVTAGDALLRVDYFDPEEARTSLLLEGLAEPRGVAADPLDEARIYLAEASAPTAGAPGQVARIDLRTYAKVAVPVRQDGLIGDGFPRPGALALDPGGTMLLVVADADPFDGTRELRGVRLGGADLGEVFERADDLPDDATGLATGPEGLRLLALPAAGDLAAGGGVQQERVVSGYDASVATVATPFDPEPEPGPGTRWRWSRPVATTFRTAPQGVTDVLVWDTRDLPQGGEVLLRVTPFDSDRGVAHTTTVAKTVLSTLQVDPVGLAVGSFPVALAAGDLDRDGRTDLVAAITEGHVAVYLQDTPAGFPPEPSFTIGSRSTTWAPRSVAVADLNGDGRPDIVSANALGNDLTVFHQAPDGTFPAVPTLSLGGPGSTGAPQCVTAADLDGDGRSDLVSANPTTRTVTVFQQLPGGTLPSAPTQTLGGPLSERVPVFVRTGDLNGDGRLDLVTANNQADDLALYFQEEEGVFPPEPDVVVDLPSPSQRSVEVGDLNGDGRLDLLAASFPGNVDVVFQGDTGAFSPVASLVLEGPASPTAAVAADLNGDGLQDVAACYLGGDEVAVFFQKHSAGLPATPDLTLAAPSPQSLVAADVSGDGAVDLVAARTPGELSLFVQAAPGEFADAHSATSGGGGDAATGDLDGDGLVDVVVAGGSGPALHLQTSHGQVPSEPSLVLDGLPSSSPPAPAAPSSAVEVADLDGDGWTDVVSANATSRTLTGFVQSGSGTFATSPTFTVELPQPHLPFDVVAADLNGDHRVDLASANGPADDVTVHLQSSSGTFSDAPSFTLGGSAFTAWPSAVTAADVDADGQLDLVSANRDGHRLTVFFQNPSGGFDGVPDLTLFAAPALMAPNDVAAADLDADGLVDLAASSSAAGAAQAVVFFQTGPGLFPTASTVALGEGGHGATAVAVADLDGDGLEDVVLNDTVDLTVELFPQAGPGRFPTSTSLPWPPAGSPPGPTTVHVADLNSDGDPDVLGLNLDLLRVYLSD